MGSFNAVIISEMTGKIGYDYLIEALLSVKNLMSRPDLRRR